MGSIMVIVILEKLPATAQGLGWPPGFFEKFAGRLPDLPDRGQVSQGRSIL